MKRGFLPPSKDDYVSGLRSIVQPLAPSVHSIHPMAVAVTNGKPDETTAMFMNAFHAASMAATSMATATKHVDCPSMVNSFFLPPTH